MDKVRAHFERHARRGITLSAVQLAEFCRKAKIPYKLEELRKVRHEFKFTAFASRYRRPLRYMSSSVAKYGVVMADMANFMPEHKRVNGGAVAFLCCVECLSGQLVAVPCPDLTTKSWERALVTVAENSAIHAVRVVVSDRDSAVKSNDASKGLRGRLRTRFGINWIFLKTRHKAFKAERMIRFLKTRLSIAERANGDGKWVEHLPGILREYNNAFVKGTNVRRRDVDQNNYLRLVGKLRGSSEPSLLFNMAETYRSPSALSPFLWRYAVGDKVLLSRRVDYALKDRHYFEKPSVAGTFGPRVFTVTACKTKLNGDYFLCPVYSLDQNLSGLFYESELSPALFASKGGGGDATAVPVAAPLRRERRRRRL